MAIIKIDGSTLTSHSSASDITGVTTTSALAEGSNLYFTDIRAVNAVEATSLLSLDSLRVDKGTSATTTQSAFANAAIQAVSTTNGVPIYSLRSTSNTSFEPAKWGTGLFEIQFDADLTGVDLDGTSQTIAFNIGDSSGSYNVAGLDSKIVDTVIDGNGDIESFNSEIEFRVNDKTAGSDTQSFPLRVASSGVTASNTTVIKDASASTPWKSFVIQHDRSNATPINNQASDIVWTAKTTNQEQFLGVAEMITQDILLDGNDDYVDFNNRLDFYTTSMSAGASTWHQLMTMNKDLIEIKADFKSSYNDFVVEGNYDSLVKQTRIETNNSKWDRSRSAMRCTTNADLDAGAGLEQFSNGFGVDTSYSLNTSEIANIGVQVLSPDFNGDNTLGYGNGQSSYFNVQLRGDGYAPGSGPGIQALRIEPWVSCVTMNTATGTVPLLIETNATAIKENKPHVFVNLTTTERNALTAESGMMIFNTTDVKLQCYDGTAWNNLH